MGGEEANCKTSPSDDSGGENAWGLLFHLVTKTATTVRES